MLAIGPGFSGGGSFFSFLLLWFGKSSPQGLFHCRINPHGVFVFRHHVSRQGQLRTPADV